MDVRPGYKQTDVGTIPNDWEVKRLGELASISAGGTPSRSIAKYWNGDIPWITTSELDFGTVSQADQFISKEGLNNSAAKILGPGTLLMALYGQGKTRGKVAVLGIEAATNQACAAISLSRGVSSAFVLHFLGSRYEAIRNLSNTGNQENLNSSLVRSIPILLPQKAEQEAIAEALSDADALIESLEQLLTKKRQIKQGAMQELLTGRTRLPGFEIKPGFKQSEVGMIPEDWEVAAVGAEFSIQLGKMLDSEKNIGVPKPFLGNRAVQWGRVDIAGIGLVRLTPSDLQRFRLRDGDLLVCEGGEVGRAAIWRQPIEECYYQKALHRLRPKCDYNVTLMLNVLRRLASNGFLLNFVSQTSIAHLPKDKFETVPIPRPPTNEEQGTIAAILSDMEAEIAAVEAKLAKAREIKQGMMQELLTGRIRLV